MRQYAVINPNAPAPFDEEVLTETPEDVAVLYSWANLEGARYRDFSATRREYRAQVRHRAAEEQHRLELLAQADAERAAIAAEDTAHEAERRARTPHGYESSMERSRALRDAEVAARQAAAERLEATRRGAAAAIAASVTRVEKREIAEAQASVQRQSAHWTEWQAQRRLLAGPQPIRTTPRLPSDPYQYAPANPTDSDFFLPGAQLQYTQKTQRDQLPGPDALPRFALQGESAAQLAFDPIPDSSFTRMGDPTFARMPVVRPATRPLQGKGRTFTIGERKPGEDFLEPAYSAGSPCHLDVLHAGTPKAPAATQEEAAKRWSPPAAPGPSTPAWLNEAATAASEALETTSAPTPPTPLAPLPASAQNRRASRWSALRAEFGVARNPAAPPADSPPAKPPILCLFSPIGGTGKTSLVATLGRALASLGEEVLLVDTTPLRLLAFYFGPTALPPGELRTAASSSSVPGAALRLVTYDLHAKGPETAMPDLAELLRRESSGIHRILLDMDAGSAARVFKQKDLPGPLAVLVPLAPDMNSVLCLGALEDLLGRDGDLRREPLSVHFVLTQFDPALPLHRDVREVLKGRLGDRLLPLTIGSSNAVPEALAEGSTVLDYAPQASVSEDYIQLAAWVYRTNASAHSAPPPQRGRDA